jgi:hypothetical protein
MASPKSQSLQKLAWRHLQRFHGEAIEYHTDDETTIEIALAVLTRPNATQVNVSEAVTFDSRNWNWLIDPEDLVSVDGHPITPEQGNWIIRVSDGTKYSLQPGPAGDLVWRWSDGNHIWRRVYCEEA